jgi:hypothetical protein
MGRVLVWDTFNGVDATAIADHSSVIDNMGTGWVAQAGASGGGSTATLSGNALSIDANDTSVVINTGESDYVVEADWTPQSAVNNESTMVFRLLSQYRYWYFNLDEVLGEFNIGYRTDSTTVTNLLNQSFTWSEGTTYRIKVEAKGSALKAYIDGALQAETNNETYIKGRVVGLARNTATTALGWDNFKVTAIEPKPFKRKNRLVVHPASARHLQRAGHDGTMKVVDWGNPISKGLLTGTILVGGVPYDFVRNVRQDTITNNNGVITTARRNLGKLGNFAVGLSLDAGSGNTNDDAIVEMLPTSHQLSTTGGAFMLLRRPWWTGYKEALSIGVDSGTNAHRFGGHLPWSDGTLYFDYGGNGTGQRISWSGYSKNVNVVENIICSAGPDGLAMYFQGELKASYTSGAASRTATTTAAYLLNSGQEKWQDVDRTGDRYEYYLAAVWNGPLTQAEATSLYKDPWQIVKSPAVSFGPSQSRASLKAVPLP